MCASKARGRILFAWLCCVCVCLDRSNAGLHLLSQAIQSESSLLVRNCDVTWLAPKLSLHGMVHCLLDTAGRTAVPSVPRLSASGAFKQWVRLQVKSNFKLLCLRSLPAHVFIGGIPSQPSGSGFEPHWRPQPAKLPSFGGYSLET